MFDMKKQLLWAKLRVGAVITLALLRPVTVFFAGNIQQISPEDTDKGGDKGYQRVEKGCSCLDFGN